MWMVKCRLGEEKNTALLLMRKFLALQNDANPLMIKSVVAPEGVKGYIYIEAFKQPHVKAAIENVSNLRMGYWKQQVGTFSRFLCPLLKSDFFFTICNNNYRKPLL